MIPFLTYPLALAGLAALPVLLGIYFLRRRFRTQPVSSLLLWGVFSRAAEGGKRIKRMEWPLLFFLELLVLLFLVTAAVDPRWSLARSRKRLIVVLDNSASMLADNGSGSARERAITSIVREAERGRFGAVLFMLTGRPPQQMGAWVSSSLEMKRVLKEWSCMEPHTALDEAVGAALEMDDGNANVLVVTDMKLKEAPATPRLKWLAVGREAPNVAFVNAIRSRSGREDKCFFEIANYSTDTVRTHLVLDAGTTWHKRIPVEISAGHVSKTTIRVPSSVQEIRAVLPDTDALRIDNEICLLRGEENKVRVRVGLSDPAIRKTVRKALDATGMLSAIPAEAQVVFVDTWPVAAETPDRWSVHVFSPEEPKAFVGPFVVDNAHAMTQGVSLDGAVWGASPKAEMPGFPVIMAGNVVLVSDNPKGNGAHDIHVQLAPPQSTLHETPAWPTIIWNLLNWRAGESEGLMTPNLRVGMVIPVAVTAGIRHVVAALPDGTRIDIPASGGKTHVAARIPGTYTITAGERRHTFAANFISAEESDLRSCVSGQWGTWTDTVTLRREYVSSAWVFLLLALGVMALHLAVVVRKGRAST